MFDENNSLLLNLPHFVSLADQVDQREQQHQSLQPADYSCLIEFSSRSDMEHFRVAYGEALDYHQLKQLAFNNGNVKNSNTNISIPSDSSSEFECCDDDINFKKPKTCCGYLCCCCYVCQWVMAIINYACINFFLFIANIFRCLEFCKGCCECLASCCECLDGCDCGCDLD